MIKCTEYGIEKHKVYDKQIHYHNYKEIEEYLYSQNLKVKL